MPYKQQQPKTATAVAEDADRVKSVSYRDNFLSGCQRPWLTKDGLWTVKGMDALPYDDFSATLNATSDEMRAKPSNGISEAAYTFLAAAEDCRDFQKKNLLGSGLDSLLGILERHQQAFETLNTFGNNEVRRSEEHVRAAVAEVTDVMAKLGQNTKAQSLVCDLRMMAVRLAHLAQWLHSTMSMCADPVRFGKSVPRPDVQHGSVALRALQTASLQHGKTALVDFLTAALVEKNSNQGKTKFSKKVAVDTYDNLDLEDIDVPVHAADDDLLEGSPTTPRQGSATPRSVQKPPSKKPQTKLAQAPSAPMDMGAMQQMMAAMMQQMMGLSRPSTATLNMQDEVLASASFAVPEIDEGAHSALEEPPRSKKSRKPKHEAHDVESAEEPELAEPPRSKKNKKAQKNERDDVQGADEADIPAPKSKKTKKQ